MNQVADISRAIPVEQLLSMSPFVVRRRIAFRDCDPAGIVYTPRFFDPIATGAVDLFMSHLIGGHGQRDPEVTHLGTPAKAVEFVFHKMAPLGGLVDVTVRPGEIRTRSFSLEFDASDTENTSLFTGSLTLICIDKATFKSIEIPELLRTKLIQHQPKAVET